MHVRLLIEVAGAAGFSEHRGASFCIARAEPGKKVSEVIITEPLP
jgi:hypothetical protein